MANLQHETIGVGDPFVDVIRLAEPQKRLPPSLGCPIIVRRRFSSGSTNTYVEGRTEPLDAQAIGDACDDLRCTPS